MKPCTDREIPEITALSQQGRYILGRIEGQAEPVVLARFIGPKKKTVVTEKKVPYLRRIK